jgi:hypothetical protein
MAGNLGDFSFGLIRLGRQAGIVLTGINEH